MAVNLRIKFKGKKLVSLPVFDYDKGTFRIILPIRDKGNFDIIKLNLPIQVVQNPSERLYRYLRMRGVI